MSLPESYFPSDDVILSACRQVFEDEHSSGHPNFNNTLFGDGWNAAIRWLRGESRANTKTTNSEFQPDDTRKLQLESFVGSVCVGSTGRLGICTHVAFAYGGWLAAGFGFDGKGVWTSADPHEIATAEAFYDKLVKRFDGALSYHG